MPKLEDGHIVETTLEARGAERGPTVRNMLVWSIGLIVVAFVWSMPCILKPEPVDIHSDLPAIDVANDVTSARCDLNLTDTIGLGRRSESDAYARSHFDAAAHALSLQMCPVNHRERRRRVLAKLS